MPLRCAVKEGYQDMSCKQEGRFTLNCKLDYTGTVLWNSSFFERNFQKKRENVVGKMTVYTKICTIPDRQLKCCFDKLVFLQFSKLLAECLNIVFVLFWCRFYLLETPPIVASCITLWKRWEGNFAIFELVKCFQSSITVLKIRDVYIFGCHLSMEISICISLIYQLFIFIAAKWFVKKMGEDSYDEDLQWRVKRSTNLSQLCLLPSVLASWKQKTRIC